MLDKYKARLVVRGDLQKNSVFDDTYAATLAARVFRALVALAAYFDLDMWQFDAVNAFTNASLDEEVYVRCPEGYKTKDTYLKLSKALYGLKRSPLLWYRDFAAKLQALGLTQVPESLCLFTNQYLIVFFYVDDIVVLCRKDPTDQEAYRAFRTELMKAFEMREMGELKWFLGIRVLRDRKARKIWLCQDSYIDKIATTFDLTHSYGFKTPMAIEELQPYASKATT
jgi:hypothetical protein